MLVSPWRRRQALAESARRRNSEKTYTEPLSLDEAQDSSDEYYKAMKDYMKDFYATFYTPEKLEARTKILKEHPEVEAHLSVLVLFGRLTEEEFWQRYEYRCDVDRILIEWERNPEKGREERGEALANGVQGWLDNSVRNLRNSFAIGPPNEKDVHAKGKESFVKKEKASSPAENKLEDSLKAAREDVEKWATMDAKDTVAQMPARSLEEVAAEKKKKDDGNKGEENPIVKWFRGLGEEAGGGSDKSSNLKRPVDVKAAPSKEGESMQTEEKRDSDKSKSWRIPTDTSEPDSGSNNSTEAETDAAKTVTNTEKKKKVSRLEQYRKSRKAQEEAAQRDEALSALTAKRDVGEIRAQISAKEKALEALANIRDRAENNETVKLTIDKMMKHKSVILALLVGFLANAFLKGSVNYICSPYPDSDVYMPPPRWYTIRGVTTGIRGLVCEEVPANQVAAEVFDNSGDDGRKRGRAGWGKKKKDYRRGDEDRDGGWGGVNQGSYSDSSNQGYGARAGRGRYHDNYDDYHDSYADPDEYGDNGNGNDGGFGGFDVNAMLSSFMKNTDFSQYSGGRGNFGNDGDDAWENAEDGLAMAPSGEPVPKQKEKKKGGIVGFFKNRRGKNKSNEVALQQQQQPSVVVHQHVHHVVHHVVHEMKQG